MFVLMHWLLCAHVQLVCCGYPSHAVLAQMWQRGRAMSKRDWTLLRVAVVACVSDVYYGRLFFGDPDTQQVLWDTDVRPSDATFLALKVGGCCS